MLNEYLANTGFYFADLRQRVDNFGSDQMKSAPALAKLYMLLNDLHGFSLTIILQICCNMLC